METITGNQRFYGVIFNSGCNVANDGQYTLRSSVQLLGPWCVLDLTDLLRLCYGWRLLCLLCSSDSKFSDSVRPHPWLTLASYHESPVSVSFMESSFMVFGVSWI